MKVFNSLSRQLEEFVPVNPNSKEIGIYTCGPTVYDYVTIGNWRAYNFGDIVAKTLTYLGYKVTYVMNETDVGHLTGDNLGDADTGEDRLEKGAKREGKTAWEIAAFYAQDFEKGYQKMNLTMPTIGNRPGFCRATEHIPEQIEMVRKIEEKGFTYRITDGIYFDTRAYEKAGNTYGELSNIDQVKEGARVEPNPEKKDARDFALWKFSPTGKKRQMEWESPWGIGFPGWHIECSAMATKYLGDQFEVHLGGEDLRSTHHPNEIAQTEAASGKKPYVKYWLHCAFLQVNGGRMGKSLGNAYTLQDIEQKGYTMKHLRYFYLSGHYRQPLNFTWESLDQAKSAYERLVGIMKTLKHENTRTKEHINTESTENTKAQKTQKTSMPQRDNQQFNNLTIEPLSNVIKTWELRFRTELENDFNMPKVLAVVWEMLRSNLNSDLKYHLIMQWDQVLGFDLANAVKGSVFVEVGPKTGVVIKSEAMLSEATINLLDQRELAKSQKDYKTADLLREKLLKDGWSVKDTPQGNVVEKVNIPYTQKS